MKKSTPNGLSHIMWVLKAQKIAFETEFLFHPKRKWRFDVAIVEHKIAIEYEGIFSSKSRHTTMSGYTSDSEKYNQAQVFGWKVFRYTAKNYEQFSSDLSKVMDCSVRLSSEVRVKTVYKFPNGNVACFDESGEQIPQLQGQHTPELLTRIYDLSSEETEFHGFLAIKNPPVVGERVG